MPVNYARCPHCNRRLPAHQGHKKTFNDLSPVEQQRSIQAMTINLKRAINNHSRNSGTYSETILKAIRTLVKTP